MLKYHWQYPLGGIIAAAFIAATWRLVLAPTASVATVAVILLGGLILVIMMPDVSEFSIGPKGVAAKIKRLESKVESAEDRVRSQEETVRQQGEQIERQQELINELVKFSMSASIFNHLWGLAVLKEYKYAHGYANSREWYFLRDNGFIRPKGDGFLDFNEGLDGRNLVDIAEPTPVGWHLVKIRRDDIPWPYIKPEDLRIKRDEL